MIEDLNHMPPDLIEDARRTRGVERVQLLWPRVHPANRRYLDQFIKDVVEKNLDPASWGRGGILVPDISLPDLLAKSVSEIIAPLGDQPRGWHRLELGDIVNTNDDYARAPAALHDDLHYSWIPPEGVTRISPDAVSISPVSQIDIAVRRWTAFRTAMELESLQATYANAFEIAEAINFPSHSLSLDAHAALEGLAQELNHGIKSMQTHGFVGSDTSYSG